MCFEPVLNCFILFSRSLIQLIRRRDEKLTTAVKYEFISVSQKAVKLVIYRSCVLPLIFFVKDRYSSHTNGCIPVAIPSVVDSNPPCGECLVPRMRYDSRSICNPLIDLVY